MDSARRMDILRLSEDLQQSSPVLTILFYAFCGERVDWWLLSPQNRPPNTEFSGEGQGLDHAPLSKSLSLSPAGPGAGRIPFSGSCLTERLRQVFVLDTEIP